MKGKNMNFDIEYIDKLSKLLKENELTEISLEDGDSAITIRKDVIVAPAAVAAAPAIAAPMAQPAKAEDTVKTEKVLLSFLQWWELSILRHHLMQNLL